MMAVLSNPWFMAFASPLLATAMTVFVRWTSRKDSDGTLRREDFAVGGELAVAAIFVLFAFAPAAARVDAAAVLSSIATGTASDKDGTVLLTTLGIAIALLAGLWVLTHFVRMLGWIRKGQLRLWLGVIVPLCYGILALFWAAYWVSLERLP